MKKRLLGILLVACLFVGFVMPAAAAGVEDPVVQNACDVYEDIKDAFEHPDIDSLKDSMKTFNELLDTMSEEQIDVLSEALDEDAFDVIFEATYVVDTALAYDGYIANATKLTALRFINAYELMKEDEVSVDMTAFISDVETVYNEAVELLPTLPAESDDPAVQNACDIFANIDVALENKDLSALKHAVEAFEAASENLSEEQMEDVMMLLGDDVYGTILETALIIGTEELYNAFINDPTALTALALVGACEMLDLIELKAFIPGLEEAYNNALELVPAEDVLSVYYTWMLLEFEMDMIMSGSLGEALDEWDALEEAFNEFGEEKLAELATLMGEDSAESAKSKILATVEDARVTYKIAYAYDEFIETWNAASAKAFVKVYDELYQNEALVDKELKSLIGDSLWDIDELYAEAKEILANADAKNDTGLADKVSPSTGEESIMLILAMLAAVGVVGTGFMKKRWV